MSEDTTIDFEITHLGGEFQVWTPDETGGCIGSGSTREEAIRDTIVGLGLLTAKLAEELKK